MSQLTESQRYEISSYLQKGKSKDEIACLVGVHRSTIYRELRRNKFKPSDRYDAEYAQYRYELRKEQRPVKRRFTVFIRERARERLVNDHWSPEQISGWSKLFRQPMVSHERLYQWIWEDKRKGGDLYLYLRRRGRKNRKRGNKNKTRIPIANRKDISERPAIVGKKKRWGDLEIDTVIGKNRKGLILTINERKTGFVWIHKLPTKEAKYVAAATEKLLMPFKGKIHTITSDNGTEFADHQYIAKTLGIDFYFATPYHSWERGANENLNGLIRQYLPKWETMEHVTQSYLEAIARKLNQRPRKRLGYMTPEQAMKFKDLEHMKKAFNIR